MSARDQLEHARRPIPRQSDVPFVIAVVCEDVPLRVERKIVGVPHTVREQFTATQIRLQPEQHPVLRLLDRR